VIRLEVEPFVSEVEEPFDLDEGEDLADFELFGDHGLLRERLDPGLVEVDVRVEVLG